MNFRERERRKRLVARWEAKFKARSTEEQTLLYGAISQIRGDMSMIETDMMKMSRGHLHIELGNMQGLIQQVVAAGNLSEHQQSLCAEVVTRLGYLRQVVAEPEPDVVSGS